jgi:hypothetical protein
MNSLLYILIALVISIPCRSQNKTIKGDSTPIRWGSGISGMYTMDKNGHIEDSSWNHIWYKCHYKTIPEIGVWTDTTINNYPQLGYRVVMIRVFLNRKILFQVLFLQPYPTAKHSAYNWFDADVYKENILQ